MGGEGGGGIPEIQDLVFSIAGGIHPFQRGVCIQKALLGLHAGIVHHGGGHPEGGPLVEGADLHSGIFQHLVGDFFAPAGVDVELSFENMGHAKRSDPGLIALAGGEVENTGVLQKFINFLHDNILLNGFQGLAHIAPAPGL